MWDAITAPYPCCNGGGVHNLEVSTRYGCFGKTAGGFGGGEVGEDSGGFPSDFLVVR